MRVPCYCCCVLPSPGPCAGAFLLFGLVRHADAVLRPPVGQVRVAHGGRRSRAVLRMFLCGGVRSMAGCIGGVVAGGRLVPRLRRPLAVRVVPAGGTLRSGSLLGAVLRTLLCTGLVAGLLERLVLVAAVAVRRGPCGRVRRGHRQLLQHAPCLMRGLKSHHDVVVGGHHLAR